MIRMTAVAVAGALGAVCFGAPARADKIPPLADQAHLLHVMLGNQKEKPTASFQPDLVKSVATYLKSYCASKVCDKTIADAEVSQVVPYDMDEDEGDELLVTFTLRSTASEGLPDPLVALLDWKEEKWIFQPSVHEQWQRVDEAGDKEEGEVKRKTNFWGVRWMESRPVVTGLRTSLRKSGSETVESEELMLAWFDWQNKPQIAAVPVRSKHQTLTKCVRSDETLKGFEAFFDVDWDLNEELVVYDVAKRTESKRLSKEGICETAPEDGVEEEWIGPIVFRMSDGEIKKLEGDSARLALLRCGALEWLDADPWVGVLAAYPTAAEAFSAREELHGSDVATLWVFDAVQFSMTSGTHLFLVTTTPYFDKSRLDLLCANAKAKYPVCVPAAIGKPLPAEVKISAPAKK